MIPEFGVCDINQTYHPRPGAYAVILDAQGRVAVFQTPHGGYLPGGGCEAGELPEETLVREVREECGAGVRDLKRIGEAVEYVYTPGHETGIRKEGVFFQAFFGGPSGEATETDHVLVWKTVEEAQEMLAHGSQAWIISQVRSF